MSDHPEDQPAGSAGAEPKPRRRSFFRLIVLAVIAAAALGYLAVRSSRARAQAEVSKKVRASGGSVSYDYQGNRAFDPQGPEWMRSVLGDEYFVTVTEVRLSGPQVTDQTIAGIVPDLKGLPNLELVEVQGTKITKAALPHFRDLKQVRRIQILGSEIDPAALKELDEALPRAQVTWW